MEGKIDFIIAVPRPRFQRVFIECPASHHSTPTVPISHREMGTMSYLSPSALLSIVPSRVRRFVSRPGIRPG